MVIFFALIWGASFQVVTAIIKPSIYPPNLPDRCKKPPRVKHPQHCCQIPPFFTEENLKSCGAADTPRSKLSCQKQICLLESHKLLHNDRESIDLGKVKKFMDKYVDNTPAFEKAIEIAKDSCVTKHMLPTTCEASKLELCIKTVLFNECPSWRNSYECKPLVEHMIFCKPFFEKEF